MIPAVFEFRDFAIGLLGDAKTTALKGDLLVYERIPTGDTEPCSHVELPACKANWVALLQVLDEIDVWSWKPEYKPRDAIDDGGGWSLRIVWGEKEVSSAGENCYPGTEDHEDGWMGSPAFDRLQAATVALLRSAGG